MKLLYINASPQGERSASARVAEAFLDAYRKTRPADEIVSMNLFERDLPAFDGPAAAGKYAILHGRAHTRQEADAWRAVERVVEEFKSADRYVFAVPMWNFGIPYRLKQYVDLIVQPGYTFSFSPEAGYRGLLTGRRALAVYARGGEYSAPQATGLDHQKPYLELILGFMGVADVRAIIVEPTLAGGPEVAEAKIRQAVEDARREAGSF